MKNLLVPAVADFIMVKWHGSYGTAQLGLVVNHRICVVVCGWARASYDIELAVAHVINFDTLWHIGSASQNGSLKAVYSNHWQGLDTAPSSSSCHLIMLHS